MQNIKVVVVGDGAVGKTSFLISFSMNAFPQEYVPTTFDNFNAVYPFEGIDIFLGLWDTAGQADFDKLRPISYRNADVYLLFFSVVNPTSLENIKERWVDEVIHHSPNAPYFLVGTQIDERENDSVVADLQSRRKRCLNYDDGIQAAKDINARGYFEISARQMQFNNLFDEVIRYVINIHRGFKKKKQMCWSIRCRVKLKGKGAKCKVCDNYYCSDCIETWMDGFKGCPTCTPRKKIEYEEEGNTYQVKKAYFSPDDKLREKEEIFKKKVAKHLKEHPDANINDIEIEKTQESSED